MSRQILKQLTVAAALLACAAGGARAQSNPGFETAAPEAPQQPADWQLGRGGSVDLDDSSAWQGRRSLRLHSDGAATRVTQRIAAQSLNAGRLRLGVYIKTQDVSDGSAGLWLRIDGAEGRLYVDSLRELGASGTQDWTYYSLEAPVLDASQSIVIGLELRGRGTAWFDAVDISPVDISQRPAVAGAAARYLNYALELIEANSIKRDSIDWPDYRAKVAEQARGATLPADTHLALRYALGNLGDGHSYLMSPRQAEALRAAPVSNARTGRGPESPRGERLSDSVAYVWLPGFAGGSQTQQADFAEQIHRLIAGLDDNEQCAWIVDLRDNTGGNLWPMLAGIGPLLGEGTAGAALHPDGSRKPFWYRDGRAGLGDYVQLRVAAPPYRTRLTQPPVAILTGPATASSGEIILGAFLARRNTASFGMATRGLSTGNRIYPLSDDAALVLTVAATSDRNGRVLAGRIIPTFEIAEPQRERPLQEQAAIAAAMHWLAQQPACANAKLDL
jgi:C-terminal processing protease CtpA/Prc